MKIAEKNGIFFLGAFFQLSVVGQVRPYYIFCKDNIILANARYPHYFIKNKVLGGLKKLFFRFREDDGYFASNVFDFCDDIIIFSFTYIVNDTDDGNVLPLFRQAADRKSILQFLAMAQDLFKIAVARSEDSGKIFNFIFPGRGLMSEDYLDRANSNR